MLIPGPEVRSIYSIPFSFLTIIFCTMVMAFSYLFSLVYSIRKCAVAKKILKNVQKWHFWTFKRRYKGEILILANFWPRNRILRPQMPIVAYSRFPISQIWIFLGSLNVVNHDLVIPYLWWHVESEPLKGDLARNRWE